MNYATYKEYASQVGTGFATRMALSNNVCIANVHLWNVRYNRELDLADTQRTIRLKEPSAHAG